MTGAKKDTEPEAKLTAATKISGGRPVESSNKLVNAAPTRCSSQRARQETAGSGNLSEELDKKKQQEWDKETTEGHAVSQHEAGAELDMTMIVQSMKRGKRSARRRRQSSAQLLGFNVRNMAKAGRNDQAIGSKKMKRTRRGTRSLCVHDRGAKGKKCVGGESDASHQSTPANLVKAQDSPADTDAVEHLSVPKSDTSLEPKEPCGIDADEFASNQSGVPVPADGTIMTNIWTDFKESEDAVADGLMATTDVISLYEAKENHTKLDPEIIPGLDLNDGAEKFDTSTAQSALASLLPTVSAPDPCIEFAVKLLKDETPLAAYVPQADEIIGKMVCRQKSTAVGTSMSAQGRKKKKD